MQIRPAQPAGGHDYRTFARLFPELRVPDDIPTADKFVREMMPTTFVAEREGVAVGVAYWQVLKSAGYLRMIITDPAVRRAGVGRALMAAVRDRFRAEGCTEFRLNVFPHNAGAIALYESFGLERAWLSRGVQFPWSILDGRTPSHAARVIDPNEDARIERELDILPGLIADARAKGRVLQMVERDGQVAAAAVFDPTFPGAYPFRARTGDDALALLHALRPFARPTDAEVAVAPENQIAIADALIEVGATLRHETLHMRGSL